MSRPEAVAAVLRRFRRGTTAACVKPLISRRNQQLAAVLRRFVCGGCGGPRNPQENKDAAVLRRRVRETPHTPYAPFCALWERAGARIWGLTKAGDRLPNRGAAGAERRVGEMMSEQRETVGLAQGKRTDLGPRPTRVDKPSLATPTAGGAR
jgi:hypothetical protein